MAFSFKSIGIISKTVWTVHRKLLPSNVTIVRHLISLPIEWKRPEKIDFWDPFRSGDGVTKHEVDWDKSPKLIVESKELETANETVKKLFTFRFMGRRHAMKQARQDMIDSVKNHNYDFTSLEVLIARRTALIRNLMEHCEKYTEYHGSFVVDKKARARMNNAINKRRRLLKKLRMWDYKKFEWILETLDLYYTPHPEAHQNIKRKPSIRKLTDKYCGQFIERKLDVYKKELEERRAEFFTRKIDKLKWMRQTEIEMGIEPTVSEDDICHAENQLTQHLEAQKEKQVTINTGNILSSI